MKSCRKCWFSVYNNPFTPVFLKPNPGLSHYKGTKLTFFLDISNRAASPTPTLLTQNQHLAQIPLLAESMSISGVFFLMFATSTYFGAIFSCQRFGAKLISITFFLRSQDALLVLTLHKLVWIYHFYFCCYVD